MAYEVKLDKQGRFVIPEVLADYAEIKDEVVFVGLGDRVEVWPDKIWSSLEKEAQEKADKALERIAKDKRIS
jgi:MraZ protein